MAADCISASTSTAPDVRILKVAENIQRCAGWISRAVPGERVPKWDSYLHEQATLLLEIAGDVRRLMTPARSGTDPITVALDCATNTGDLERQWMLAQPELDSRSMEDQIRATRLFLTQYVRFSIDDGK